MTDAVAPPRYRPDPIRRGQAHELVAAQLRVAIVSGELQPGARLPTENELCESFQVSRATIREALGTLVGEGLITKSRGLKGGSFVTAASLDQVSDTLHSSLHRLQHSGGMTVEEVAESRLLLEVPAARLAAQRRTDADIDSLRACAHLNDPAHSTELRMGRRFHRAVAVASGNRLLQLAIEPINLALATQMDKTRYRKGFLAQIDDHHRGIAEAIADRDAERSAQLMEEHLAALSNVYGSVWKAPDSAPPSADP